MSNLTVRIYSFGYHFSGIPNDPSGNNGGFVFDCRFLPNPGREDRYKQLTGKTGEVADYLSEFEMVDRFLKAIFQIIDSAVENYTERNFTDLMVSFGCTGGQHRSVFCAEKLAAHLKKKGIRVKLFHTEYPELNSD